MPDKKNNLIQFLVIYDIYIYFEEFLYLNEEKKIAINKYFDKLNKGEKPENSFISFLDINERKLIKPYHEDLQFYKQIPTDKYETFQIRKKRWYWIGIANKRRKAPRHQFVRA